MKPLKLFAFLVFTSLVPALLFPETAAIKVTLKIFPQEFTLSVDGKTVTPAGGKDNLRSVLVTKGGHAFTFSCEGFTDKTVRLEAAAPLYYEDKLERTDSRLKLIKEIRTGIQPKSVEFTRDGKYLVAALLGDKTMGIQVFDGKTFELLNTIALPPRLMAMTGLVEIAFVRRLNEMWVSQMPANLVHVFDMDGFALKATLEVKGKWPKVIMVTADEKRAFVSNYTSDNITVFDIDTKILKIFKTGKTPRGMAESPDGKFVYVGIYDTGVIQKFDSASYKLVKTLDFGYGSKRHLVMDRARNILYASDMYTASVFAVNGADDTLIKEIKIDHKINTIGLTSDGRYLFAASRGPNDDKSYLNKGPRFGKAYMVDTATFTVIDWAWGRNQPTGLAVSPDNRYMAFTDFKDNGIEIYEVGAGMGFSD